MRGSSGFKDEVVGKRQYAKPDRRSQRLLQSSDEFAPLSCAHAGELVVGLCQVQLPTIASEAHPQATEPEGVVRGTRRPRCVSAPEQRHFDASERRFAHRDARSALGRGPDDGCWCRHGSTLAQHGLPVNYANLRPTTLEQRRHPTGESPSRGPRASQELSSQLGPNA